MCFDRAARSYIWAKHLSCADLREWYVRCTTLQKPLWERAKPRAGGDSNDCLEEASDRPCTRPRHSSGASCGSGKLRRLFGDWRTEKRAVQKGLKSRPSSGKLTDVFSRSRDLGDLRQPACLAYLPTSGSGHRLY